ncbi:hypothetical protein IP88_03980 [alpha proteobacterium AAP81b]|nr:hypothetical protein IP88_03980 [alpha proteobacterium AAP81b]
MRRSIVMLLLAVLVVSGCKPAPPTYTLYRNSRLNQNARVHMATFDTNDPGNGSGTYNEENCAMIAALLTETMDAARDPIAPVHYWCEPGRYRPQ